MPALSERGIVGKRLDGDEAITLCKYSSITHVHTKYMPATEDTSISYTRSITGSFRRIGNRMFATGFSITFRYCAMGTRCGSTG